ncbi:MAG TPA: LysR family transcriptional regulator [Microvirga sp.]|jgi:DNA-binding transcriptional LysR family regulator|nr:LysR family transcriptional regulator [Microvirga sp.]
MDLADLSYLATVDRAGSLSAAARSLNMTQPGLTKAIRRLEGRFGCRILVRLPRGVTLTAQGRALLRHVKLIEAQLQDAQDEIRSLQSGAVGSLRIGAGPSWLTRALPRVITQLSEIYPGLSFRVVGGFNDHLIEALRDGELDAVVSALPDRPLQGFEFIPLTMDRLTVVARRDHPLRRIRRPQPRDTERYAWALPGRNVLSRTRLDALFQVAGLEPPQAKIESDSISFIAAALRDSDMLSFATSQILLSDMDGIAELAIPGLSMTRSAGMIFRSSDAKAPVSTTFVSSMKHLAAELGKN